METLLTLDSIRKQQQKKLKDTFTSATELLNELRMQNYYVLIAKLLHQQ